MEDPMTQPEGPFQPRSVSDVLVDAFELFRRDWTNYVLMTALLVIPLALAQVGVSRAFVDEQTGEVTLVGGALLFSLVGAVLTVVVQLVVSGALTRSGVSAMAGQRLEVAGSLRHAFRRMGGLLWVILLSSLAIFAGFIALVIPGIILAVLLYVSVQAFIVEGHKGSAALSRSWTLVKPHFWHVLGVVILAALLTGITSAILGQLGGDSFFGEWLFGSIGLLLVVPYTAMVTVVLYVELRARREALTVSQLRDDLARTSV
jgi:hypothetical protein